MPIDTWISTPRPRLTPRPRPQRARPLVLAPDLSCHTIHVASAPDRLPSMNDYLARFLENWELGRVAVVGDYVPHLPQIERLSVEVRGIHRNYITQKLASIANSRVLCMDTVVANPDEASMVGNSIMRMRVLDCDADVPYLSPGILFINKLTGLEFEICRDRRHRRGWFLACSGMKFHPGMVLSWRPGEFLDTVRTQCGCRTCCDSGEESLYNSNGDCYSCSNVRNLAQCSMCGALGCPDHMAGGWTESICRDCYAAMRQPAAPSPQGESFDDWARNPRLLPYSWHPDWPRRSKDWENPVYLGVELELLYPNGYAGAVYGHAAALLPGMAVFKSDSSISSGRGGGVGAGGEMILCPMTWQSFPRGKMREFLKLMQDSRLVYGEAAGSCGLHVHVSRTALGTTAKQQTFNIKKLRAWCYTYPQFVYEISRRDWGNLNRWSKLRHPDMDSDKYVAVNSNHSETVEFRIFNSTIYPDPFFASIQFAEALCQYVKVHLCNSSTMEARMHRLPPSHFRDWVARQKRFHYLERLLAPMVLDARRHAPISWARMGGNDAQRIHDTGSMGEKWAQWQLDDIELRRDLRPRTPAPGAQLATRPTPSRSLASITEELARLSGIVTAR